MNGILITEAAGGSEASFPFHHSTPQYMTKGMKSSPWESQKTEYF